VIDQRRVLVVDELSETREVLQAILEPRGLRVESSTTADALSENDDPDVIVIDMESAAAQRPSNRHWNKVPRVIIGSARLSLEHGPTGEHPNRYLSKPFQYPELIQAIEQLLAPDHQ